MADGQTGAPQGKGCSPSLTLDIIPLLRSSGMPSKLHLRFTLSYHDVEELLAERRLEASYETVRRWVLKFGPPYATSVDYDRGPAASGIWMK
jgi:hypothetical protein